MAQATTGTDDNFIIIVDNETGTSNPDSEKPVTDIPGTETTSGQVCGAGTSGTVGNLSGDSVVNLRQGPGTSYSIVGKISDGESVKIIATAK